MSSVHVRVRVAGEEYALPVSEVSEVAEFGAVTPIPGAPPRILGAINLRGQVLPVIDMVVALGLGDAGSARQRILIAEDGPVQAGLAVDEVLNVGELAGEPADTESPYLTGAALVDGAMVGIVDVSALLSPEAA